jgi:hypothetical protein
MFNVPKFDLESESKVMNPLNEVSEPKIIKRNDSSTKLMNMEASPHIIEPLPSAMAPSS